MKKILLFISILFFSTSAWSYEEEWNTGGNPYIRRQVNGIPSFPSPNAQGFTVFGQIPVSLFTGTPDITIPLYEIIEGDIRFPILLSYHIANRKVNNIPSWVGLGWSLDVGGVIIRNMRGGRDEEHHSGDITMQGYMYNNKMWKNLSAYPYMKGNVYDPRYSNTPPLCPKDVMNTINHLRFVDATPDEFVFYFMGYSGTFQFDGNTNQFLAISDDDIKVVLNSGDTTIKHLNCFNLITPDGSIYEFGGENATELSQGVTGRGYGDGCRSAWFLTKITSPNGHIIELEYEKGAEIVNLAPFHYILRFPERYRVPTCSVLEFATMKCPEGEVIKRVPQGQIIRPVYLKEIKFSTGKIVFNRSLSSGMSYDNEELNWENFYYVEIGEWQKLDSITFYSESKPFKRFNFQYVNTPEERLKLFSLQEETLNTFGNATTTMPPYTFEYNSNKMPTPCSDHDDHWGYAQISNYNTRSSYEFDKNNCHSYHTLKGAVSDPEVHLAEILERINYPSGGFSIFTYESHDYSKAVSTERDYIESYNTNQFAGGVRIKTIKSYDKLNENNTSYKEYFYNKFDSLTGLPTSQNRSSGILSGIPNYVKEFNRCCDMQSEPSLMFSSALTSPLGQVAMGSHVGYSEVVEIERAIDNDAIVGYRSCKFTNFDEDCYGNIHCDYGLSGYFIYSGYNAGLLISGSKHFERGKMTTEYLFTADSRLVQRTDNRYQTININPTADKSFFAPNYIPSCNLRGYEIESSGIVVLQEIYVLASKTITTYPTNNMVANDSVKKEIFYTYNDRRLISKETTIDSKGRIIENQYFYPDDYVLDDCLMDECKALRLMQKDKKHMINYLVESKQFINGKLRAGSIRTYQRPVELFPEGPIILGILDNSDEELNVLPKPKNDYTLAINNTLENIETLSFDNGMLSIHPAYKQTTSYINYGLYGNLREFLGNDKISTTIIWGYKNTRPVASIQNISRLQLVNIFGQETLESIENSTNSLYIQMQLNMMRNHNAMKAAYMHTYTYKLPFGISSATDPAGITTHYEYDNFGRLITKKDNNLFILEKIVYNYK